MVAINDLLDGARAGIDQTIKNLINPLLGFKAISTDDVDACNEATQFLGEYLNARGFTSEIHRATGADSQKIPHFMIAREKDFDPSLPTVLIYGHLDGVRADGTWNIDGDDVDPFKVTRNGGYLYGRQIIDDVGPLAANIQALELSREKYGKQSNVIFMTEAGEEIGSPWVKELVQDQQSILNVADLCVVTI